MRAPVVGTLSRRGWIKAIVFVKMFVNVIWLACCLVIRLESSTVRVGIVLVRCVPTALSFGRNFMTFSNAIASIQG